VGALLPDAVAQLAVDHLRPEDGIVVGQDN